MKAELTRRERQIIEVIYRLGESSATDIMKELPDELANATVRTQLRILKEKGIVRHRVDGKRFLYSATEPRKSAAKAALRKVVEVFFGGSLEDALATHLSDPKAKLSAEQLQRLRELIDKHDSKGH